MALGRYITVALVALISVGWVQIRDLRGDDPTAVDLLEPAAADPFGAPATDPSDPLSPEPTQADPAELNSEEPAAGPADAKPEKSEPELIQERFPNGNIKTERQVTQDAHGNYVNHGTWKMRDARGTEVAAGEFRHDQRQGTWYRWHAAADSKLFNQRPYSDFAGPFFSQANFEGGKLNGSWAIFDGKQRKISQWQYADGQRHGKWTWWYPNGRVIRTVDYREGDLDGQLQEFGPDGRQLTNDTYQAGRKLAAKIAYHGGSQKKSEGVYLHAKETPETPDDWWEAKPAPLTRQGKDERHGRWVSWFPNGQLQIEGEYRNDLTVGKFTWWHSNGQKASEGSYEEGKQHGQWIWWHPNGQKSVHGEYDRGNPTGRWTSWHSDGKVIEVTNLSHSEGRVVTTRQPQHEAKLPKPLPPRPASRIKR